MCVTAHGGGWLRGGFRGHGDDSRSLFKLGPLHPDTIVWSVRTHSHTRCISTQHMSRDVSYRDKQSCSKWSHTGHPAPPQLWEFSSVSLQTYKWELVMLNEFKNTLHWTPDFQTLINPEQHRAYTEEAFWAERLFSSFFFTVLLGYWEARERSR